MFAHIMWGTLQGHSQKWDTSAKTVTAMSIKSNHSKIWLALPKSGMASYGVAMPRTDENGRQLKALLDYLLDGDIDAKAIYDALGTSSSTYYRRIKEPDYPNAEELRRVADRFDLSYPDLQVRFGLMSREEVWSYLDSAPLSVATVTEPVTSQRTVRRQKLSQLVPRQDAPPL
ncbi:hypothetical protein MARA_12980 [Mycolicibacterium arabiense]|uniref:Uncharacterized protein n=2 Tax=Mycobacteriaceae TaxID=1762 RepID=A0A7I7RUE3_9MYCO|nr:hypothetical protein MARA_12980 [Mycolicibacterium arabiense]